MEDGGVSQRILDFYEKHAQLLAMQWLSKVVFAICRLVALPLELVMNRRMGRRYAGTGVLFVSLLVYLAIVNYGSLRSYGFQGGFGMRSASIGRSDSVLLLAGFIIALAIVRHRFANWWRFRSEDQVHSYSNGIPFWLHPPKFLLIGTRKAKPIHLDANKKRWDDGLPKGPMGIGVFFRVLRAFLKHLGSKVSLFMREWRSGAVPTGPIAFAMATIVHPVIMLLCGALIGGVCKPLAYYMLWASIAIFVKGRIEKAETVERIYDLFDAKLDQEATAALANPVKLREVEAKGVVIPGFARSLVDVAKAAEPAATVAPDFGRLLTPKTPPGAPLQIAGAEPPKSS